MLFINKFKEFELKSSHAQIIFKIATQVMIYYCKKAKKKLGVTDFVLERPCPEKYPKSEKSGLVSL